MPEELHLAVALDGAGWHPAAWREPAAQPAALFTAGYRAGLAAEAEAGPLDFLTIEDSLALQSASRRGGYLERADRYERAAAFVQAARELRESRPADAIAADKETGEFLSSSAVTGHDGGEATPGTFGFREFDFDLPGNFTVPRSPQVHPVILQAGDSGGGREFAAHSADAIFTRHSAYDAGRAFSAGVKGRLSRYGRSPDSPKVLPGASFTLGDTDAPAREHARYARRQQVRRRPRPCCWNRCGTPTCRPSTPRARCRRPPPSPAPRRSTAGSRTTPATGSSWCRT
jgi:alkanesulfonate monooxygenase SsuD/methylene tetrahydromethanopterin reductase-like flavin-dependent oxidoreductase (luciferase family)